MLKVKLNNIEDGYVFVEELDRRERDDVALIKVYDQDMKYMDYWAESGIYEYARLTGIPSAKAYHKLIVSRYCNMKKTDIPFAFEDDVLFFSTSPQRIAKKLDMHGDEEEIKDLLLSDSRIRRIGKFYIILKKSG